MNSFQHREHDRISRLMTVWQPTDVLVRLRIAKETLEWVMDPQHHVAPSDSILNEGVRMSPVESSPVESVGDAT